MVAMCGVTTTPGCDHSGWPSGSGSFSNTSTMAPRRRPLSSAAIRSASTRCSPRPQWISVAPSGSASKVLRFRMPRVCAVSGSRQTSTSVFARNSVQPSSPLYTFTPAISRGVRAQPLTL